MNINWQHPTTYNPFLIAFSFQVAAMQILFDVNNYSKEK